MEPTANSKKRAGAGQDADEVADIENLPSTTYTTGGNMDNNSNSNNASNENNTNNNTNNRDKRPLFFILGLGLVVLAVLIPILLLSRSSFYREIELNGDMTNLTSLSLCEFVLEEQRMKGNCTVACGCVFCICL